MFAIEAANTLQYVILLRRSLVNNVTQANGLRGEVEAALGEDELEGTAALRARLQKVVNSRPRVIELALGDIEMASVAELAALSVFFAVSCLGNSTALLNLPRSLDGMSAAQRASKLAPALAVQLVFELATDLCNGIILAIGLGDTTQVELNRGAQARVVGLGSAVMSALAHFAFLAGAGCDFCDENFLNKCPV